MPEFASGLIQGGEALSRDRYRDAQIKETQDMADIRRQLFGEKQQEKQEDQVINNYLMRLMKTLGQPDQGQAGPQAPPPGQASQPAPPPMAPPTQGPPPMSPFGPPGGQMNPMLLASMQRPQVPMMTGGGAPPMAGPAPGGPPTGPAPQGPPPVGPQGPPAAPPQAPPSGPPMAQGWMPGATAKPDLGGGLGGGAMGGGIMPRAAPSVAQITAEMDKMNIPPNMQYKVLSKAWPIFDAQNKEKLEQLKAQAEIWNAGAAAMRAQRELQESGKGKATPFMTEAKALEDPNVSSEEKDLIRKHLAKMDAPPKYMMGGGAGSAGGGGDFAAKYDKMNPLEQEKLDIQSWAYIQKGTLPYRRGGGGGNDKNELMYQNTARIAASLGMGPQELVAQSAEFKATAMSLQQVTKDLSAIEPFKDMLDKNSSIAKELAKKAIATDSQWANKSINWLRQNATDNPMVAEYLAQIRIVQTEAARVLNNPRLVGQLTDTARQEMEGIVNGNMPLNAVTAVLNRLESDATNRIGAMQKKESSLRRKLEGKSEAQPAASPSGALTPDEEKELADLKKKYGR